jgi:hypothetical protein
MPTLIIGTRSFRTDERSVQVAAERMFRLTDAQRRNRVEAAKTQLARAFDDGRAERAQQPIRRAVATILSQGIREI